jgi:hypothetical protein
MAKAQGAGEKPAKDEAPKDEAAKAEAAKAEGRPMVGITIREVTYKAVGMQREAVDGDVLFRGEIAADVTPGDLFRMLETRKARFVEIGESQGGG